jgi:hypothetical protein
LGNQLSGEVASADMFKHNVAIKNLMDTNEIREHMFRRYVDDQLGAYKALARGMMWDQNTRTFIFSQDQWEKDEG